MVDLSKLRAMVPHVSHAVLWAAAGALAFFIVLPPPKPDPQLPAVMHVTRKAIEAMEPTAKPSTLSKLARPVATLEWHVIADGVGTDIRDAFIAASSAADSSRSSSADSSGVHRTIPPRLGLQYAGDITRARLNIFTVTSDGAKDRLTYNVCGHVSWRMVGDTAVVQGGRLCWAHDALGIAGGGLLGYGLAHKDPVAIGGGALAMALRKWVFK